MRWRQPSRPTQTWWPSTTITSWSTWTMCTVTSPTHRMWSSMKTDMWVPSIYVPARTFTWRRRRFSRGGADSWTKLPLCVAVWWRRARAGDSLNDSGNSNGGKEGLWIWWSGGSELPCFGAHGGVHCLLVYFGFELAHQIEEFWHPLLYLWQHWFDWCVWGAQVPVLVCVDEDTGGHLQLGAGFEHFRGGGVEGRRGGHVEGGQFGWFKGGTFCNLASGAGVLDYAHHLVNGCLDVVLQFLHFLVDFIPEPDVLQLYVMQKFHRILADFHGSFPRWET